MKKHFQLKKYFLMTGGIAFLVFTIIFGTGVYSRDMSNLENLGERENIILSGFLGKLLEPEIKQLLSSSNTSQEFLRNHKAKHNIDSILSKFSKQYPILKVKIFAKNTTTIYSSIADEIGKKPSHSSSLEEVFKLSNTSSELVLKNSFQTSYGEMFDRKIVETYIPIHNEDNEIIAAFELYSDVTNLVDKSINKLYKDIIFLVIEYLGLFIIIYLLVRHADNIIKNQYKELDEVNHQLELAKDNLEAKVQERTQRLSNTVEKLNQEIQDRMKAQNANQAKSDFLSSMSHELRTPLNAIIGFSQILEISDSLNKYDLDNVNEIKKAGDHLLNLINDILDLSKIEAGKIDLSIEAVDLKGLTSECFSLIKPFAQKHDIQIDYQLTTDLAVRADYTRLKQVLLNLLSNGIKYNRKNGKVSLTIKENKPQHTIRFEVIDTGEGISKEQIPLLFQPFERLNMTKSEIEGTGIGLSISQKIIDLMEGNIGVETELGKGTTFWIELPAENAKVDKEITNSDISTNGEGIDHASEQRKFHVLYIEDNPANIKLVSRALKPKNYIKLHTAHLPEVGIELAIENKPSLILLDINMPSMNGYQVLNIIRQNQDIRHIPVFAITANAMPDDIKKGLAAGFNEYLTKPLDIAVLNELVDKYIGISSGG
ncbi:ATP-binding protein [Thiomicrorhabdus sediminis]|uniref:histidine kinase n=1 Tax=Thiomicrorhabdus sediminis TaxID=2580412 RepID=A0A4P9K5P1_9GAMM|nr:ATP-binding protein [Thiomicrorhabdus sediminis]QCU89790.1 response regulator [Thiomicrorhabdus sediminis]